MADSVILQDMYQVIKLLDREDKVKLGEMLRDHLSREAGLEFSPGDKIKFATRHGILIEGVILRLTGKNMKIASKQDRNGNAQPRAVNWTVSRQLVSPA